MVTLPIPGPQPGAEEKPKPGVGEADSGTTVGLGTFAGMLRPSCACTVTGPEHAPALMLCAAVVKASCDGPEAPPGTTPVPVSLAIHPSCTPRGVGWKPPLVPWG